MPELPSGTVTFLFTDIERSTESAAALGDEKWAEALAVHHDLLRPVFGKHGGVEVKTEGDAFFVAFVHARDAVTAAVDGQRALESCAWPGEARLRVRMGMHTGEALVRDNDYVGHAVHKAKRVSDAGHGGQIVLSQTTADLVRDETALLDLGPHRLKDLGEPQQLYQVGHQNFPPLRSLEAFRHNLPAQRSSFVGRERELAEIRRLLDQHRLLTVTGVGGCGKTRLALQVGADLVDAYPDGVFFVDFSPVADGSLVAPTTMDVVRAPQGQGTVIDMITRHLAAKTCLLLLDNCEHVLDDCAELVDATLTSCPNVRILATSRESMEVQGEQSWRVPSLSLTDDIAASEAVRLFKARAQAADASFDLTAENAPVVAEICKRLDGIPLAIEFAAARVSHLSPEQIAERLGDMFKLLTGGRRRVQRQHTLQAALDWSYDLLDPDEQRLLRTLAVFSGGFTLEAVEGVHGGGVIELLGSLVSKSLVTTEQRAGHHRYRLLETVRLYAEEKLRENGEADKMRTRHRDWYHARLAATSVASSWMDLRVLTGIEAELGNYRAALSWSLADGRRDLIATMVSRLAAFFANGGFYDEGYEWASLVVADPSAVAVDDQIDAHALLGYISLVRLDGRAIEHTRRAIAIAGERSSAGLVVAMIFLGFNLGILAAVTASAETAAEARRMSDESIARARAMGGPDGEAFAQHYRGSTELLLGDLPAAAARFELALSLVDPTGQSLYADPRLRASIEGLLSFVRHLLGDADEALAAANRAEALLEHARDIPELDLPFAETSAMYSQGPPSLAVAAAGEVDRARRVLRSLVRYRMKDASPLMLNDALLYCAALAFIEGKARRAALLFSAGRYAGGAADRSGVTFRTPVGVAVYRHYVPLVRAALGPDEARRLRDEGRAMTLEAAAAYALEGLGA